MGETRLRTARSGYEKRQEIQSAAAESLGLLQVITVMLANATIVRWERQRDGAKTYKRPGWGLSGKAYSVLERYFEVGTKKAGNLASGRRWIQMMAGSDKDVGNKRVKRYYMKAFGVQEDLRNHAVFLKSAESIFRNTDDAIAAGQYTEDDVIKLFIRKYSYERIRTALSAMMSEDARHITLDEKNELDYDSITVLMWRISFAYLTKTNNGARRMSKREIDRWIEEDPDLKDYYALVLKRMDLAIGPAIDTLAEKFKIRIS